MNTILIDWLNRKLIKEKLSARQLSLRIGKSPTYVSQVLRGNMDPGLSFYVGLANEFDIPVEDIIKMAVGKPPEESNQGPLTAKEIWRLANTLTAEERQEVLDFLDYLFVRRDRRGTSG